MRTNKLTLIKLFGVVALVQLLVDSGTSADDRQVVECTTPYQRRRALRKRTMVARCVLS